MTVQVQTPENSYTANGATDTFAFNFRILANADLKVRLDSVLQTEGVDYNLQNVTESGGDVVFTSTPAADQIVNIKRETPRDQQIDYTAYDPFPAETHELGLDKLTMIYQEKQNGFTEATEDEVITGTWSFSDAVAITTNGFRFGLGGGANNSLRGAGDDASNFAILFGATYSAALNPQIRGWGADEGSGNAGNLNLGVPAIGRFQLAIGPDPVLQGVPKAEGSQLVADRTGVLRKTAFRNPDVITDITVSGTALIQDQEGQIARILFDAVDEEVEIPQLEANTRITLVNRSSLGINDCILTPGSGVTVLVMEGNAAYNALGEIRMERGTVAECQWESANLVLIWGSGLTRA